MTKYAGRDIIHRWKSNPLITIEDLPFKCSDIWNAGVSRLNGRHVMLLTVESLEGRCMIYRAWSKNGTHFTVDPHPFVTRSEDAPWAAHESFGIRDPRITRMDDTFYITYVADGDHGLRVALAKTDDFESIERLGFLSQVDAKNGALFPSKINGRYALLYRPEQGFNIWIKYSDDLVFWGDGQVVMTPRGGYWDTTRIGAAAPPIVIEQGWLLIYYGQKHTSAGPLVRLGAAILDRDIPSKVIARSNIPILAPREQCERIGDVGNVVFSCGAILEDDGIINLYYGASDSCICLGQATVDEIVRACMNDNNRQ
ncbi:MAG: glycoside hydrolase family 130 protein [Actinomycetia bacterium]|nr:glycoside hydrolase family 130 protein [Actinomycetes bacterium]